MVSEANRLMLCPGIFWREGWKCLDAFKRPHIDYPATIPPLPAEVKAIQWDEIEWVHGITSLYPWEAKDILPELLAVLKPGGKLVLEQPNFEHTRVSVPMVFGNAEDQRDPLLMNKWAYRPEDLTELLRQTGFSRVEILPAQHHVPSRDFRVEAYR